MNDAYYGTRVYLIRHGEAVDNCGISIIDREADNSYEVFTVNSVFHLRELRTEDFF